MSRGGAGPARYASVAEAFARATLHFPRHALLLAGDRHYELAHSELVIPCQLLMYPFVLFAPANAALFAVFIALQLVRSRLEEQKLLRVFPAYRDTVGKSAWFWKA